MIEALEQQLRISIASATTLEALDGLEVAIAGAHPDVVLGLTTLLFRQKRDVLVCLGDDIGAREAALTASLFGAELVRRIERPLDGSGFFEPWWDGPGTLEKAFTGVPADLFARYWSAVQDSRLSPVARSVYALAVWELHQLWRAAKDPRCPKKPDVVATAVPILADAAEVFLATADEPRKRGMDCCPYWEAAFYLGCLLRRFELLEPVLSRLRRATLALEVDAPHWALALARSEIHVASVEDPTNRSLVTVERLRELLSWLTVVDQRLRKLDLLGPSMTLVDDRERIEKLLGSTPDPAERARRRASVMEYRAGHHPSKMVRSIAWKEAAAIYQAAGLRDEAAHAKAQARVLMQEAQECEFQTFEVHKTTDFAQLDQELNGVFGGTQTIGDVIAHLAAWPLAPALVDPAAAVEQSGSVLASLVTQVNIVDDRIVGSSAGKPAGDVSMETQTVMAQQVMIACSRYLPRIFQRMSEISDQAYDAILEAIASAPCARPGDRLFLETGIRRVVEGDFVSAVHVLVPRLEQLVRRHLIANHVDATALNREGALQEKTFGELLRAGEKVLPTWIGRLYRATLTEEWGLNLRNNIAHGLARPADCEPQIAFLVIYLLLTIALLSHSGAATPDSTP